MTTFLDGPAQGHRLMIKRAPVFLRIVQDAAGKWDALDQLEDTARPGETIFAYQITGQPAMCHIRKNGGGSGFYPLAEYKVLPAQPTDAQMRDNNQWSEWCHAQPEARP